MPTRSRVSRLPDSVAVSEEAAREATQSLRPPRAASAPATPGLVIGTRGTPRGNARATRPEDSQVGAAGSSAWLG